MRLFGRKKHITMEGRVICVRPAENYGRHSSHVIVTVRPVNFFDPYLPNVVSFVTTSARAVTEYVRGAIVNLEQTRRGEWVPVI